MIFLALASQLFRGENTFKKSVRSIENDLRGAVIVYKRNELGILPRLFETFKMIYRCAREAIDKLTVIADNENIRPLDFAPDYFQKFILHSAGILMLVDQDIQIPLANVRDRVLGLF